jgi:hypothetical protein
VAALLDAILEFLRDEDWDFAPQPGANVVRTAFRGENGEWGCFAQTREELDQAVFFSVFGTVVDEDRRLAMAELLAWVNFDLVIGNFEIDLDGGHVRYKTSIDVEGSELTAALVKPLVYNNVMTMDRYLHALQAVASDGADPRAAYDEVQGAV